MNTLLQLQTKAIQSAQQHLWDQAIFANEEILSLDPENISAMNRLGFCYLQTQQVAKAKSIYAKVLELDQYNSIAKKYLELVKMKHFLTATMCPACCENFIEEPGKTKTIQLCRLADTATLLSAPIGTPCKLQVKAHRIAVETENGKYLGSLPDDISHHLSKLLNGGNKYTIVVKSVDKSSCILFIKETHRAKRFQHTVSFPTLLTSMGPELHEHLLVNDGGPVNIGDVGEDEDIEHETEPNNDQDDFERDSSDKFL